MKKPQHCNQEWTKMAPAVGGRICGKCEKKILDFTGKSWGEIMRVQAEHGYAACGMYSAKQLKYWGGEVPKSRGERWAKAAALAAGMALGTAGMAQTAANDGGGTGSMIRGTVLGSVEQGSEPLVGAKVLVLGTTQGTLTDMDGNFQINLPFNRDQLAHTQIEISYLEMVSDTLDVKDYLPANPAEPMLPVKVVMKEDQVELVAFYVTGPSKRELRRMRKEEKSGK